MYQRRMDSRPLENLNKEMEMNEAEAHYLLSLVTSKNFNNEGFATEWHPLAISAGRDFEADVIEVGFIAAYYMYDENVWGEGALAHVTQGHDARG